MPGKEIVHEGVTRQAKEKLLQQRGIVIWLTGLSGSGKSTLAVNLENQLHRSGYFTALLDGDLLRNGLNTGLGFTPGERTENIRRAAEVARIMVDNGIITICSFISPTHEIRQMARHIIGPQHYFEVFLDCSFETCSNRDVKGLYKKALSGELKNFTGLDAPFEKPEQPWLILDTENTQPAASIQLLLQAVLPIIDQSLQAKAN